MACCEIASMPASVDTSATTALAVPPAWPISAASVASASPLRAASTTRAPRLAAMRAVTRPIPEEAPVMTTVCRFSALSETFIFMACILVRGGGFGAFCLIRRPRR